MKGVKNNFIMKCIIAFLFVAIAVVALFAKVIDIKNKKALEADYPSTTYEILAAKDLDNNYPSTVSEVLKLYNRYLQYIYNEKDIEDDEFEVLVDHIRQMWSDEWLKLNDRESHLEGFHNEVDAFREAGKVMSNYLVSDGSTAKKFVTPDGVDGKTLTCSYLYSEDGKPYKMNLQYYFLSEEGKWKILYYERADERQDAGKTDKPDKTDKADKTDKSATSDNNK